MKISIIVVTIKLGCFDILFNSLGTQSMEYNDFEVIVVDDWYKIRREFISKYLFPYKVIHVPPENPRDFFDTAQANNTGLRLANGELVIFLTDLIWIYPDFLLDHWTAYQSNPGYSLTGYIDRYPLPKLKYQRGVSIDMSYLNWSVFEEEFDVKFADQYFRMVNPVYLERKGGHLGRKIPGTLLSELPGYYFYAGLNESIPMHVLRHLNGWDQRYDGGYGGVDIDLGTRANMIGWKFLVKTDSINKKFGKQGDGGAIGIMPIKEKKELRARGENYKIYRERIKKIIERIENVETPSGHGAWR